MTSKQQRERLEAIRTRAREATSRQFKAAAAAKAAREAGDRQAEQAAETIAEEAQQDAAMARALEVTILNAMAGEQARTFGADLRGNLEAQAKLAEIAGSTVPLGGKVALGPIVGIEEMLEQFGGSLQAAVDLGSSPIAGTTSFGGIQGEFSPPTSILDVWPSRPMTSRRFEFLQRAGTIPSGLGPVTPGAIKPEANLDYTPAEREAEVHAVWIKALRADLDDVEGLIEDVRAALGTGVRASVERALIAEIVGATGLVAPTLTGHANLGDAAAVALQTLRDSGVQPNVIVASSDLYLAETIRKAEGSGEYVGQIVAGRLHNVPIVSSPALDARTLLVADTRQAGFLGVRSPLQGFLSDSDSDDFVRNMCTILLETRIAPIVKAPAAIALGTVPAA